MTTVFEDVFASVNRAELATNSRDNRRQAGSTCDNECEDPKMNLRFLLPILMPRAIEWAEAIAADVALTGKPLDASGLSDARTVGVQRAGKIRASIVDRLPIPSDSELRAAALQTGLLGPTMVGLILDTRF